MELKLTLARQPGPEAAEQLQIYRQTLQEKSKQIKVSSLCSFLAKLWGTHQSKSAAAALGASFPNANSTEVSLFSTSVPGGAGQTSELPLCS